MGKPQQIADWLSSIAGSTGVNSMWLKRAADAGVIQPGMSPDEIYRAVAGMARPAPVRQLELPGLDSAPAIGPAAAAEPDIRALIPMGRPGQGVPVELAAPGVPVSQGTDMIPAPLRGLPEPRQRRVGTTAPGRPELRGLPAPQRRGLPAPQEPEAPRYMDAPAPDRIAGEFDRLVLQDLDEPMQAAGSSMRASPPSGGNGLRKAAAATLAAAGAGVGYHALQGINREREAGGELTTDGTADLVEESRPAPKVDATEEAEFTQRFKDGYTARDNRMKAKGQGGYGQAPDYRAQAEAMIEDLNARRRKAGREVPEARQMKTEIDRLLDMSNKQRNAPGYKPRNTLDPREQALIMLQKLNAERQEAGAEVPHAAQVMEEVRRLQALGDRQRWGG